MGWSWMKPWVEKKMFWSNVETFGTKMRMVVILRRKMSRIRKNHRILVVSWIVVHFPKDLTRLQRPGGGEEGWSVIADLGVGYEAFRILLEYGEVLEISLILREH